MNRADWPWLAATLAWNFGLACILAVAGFAYWRAQNDKTRLFSEMRTPTTLLFLNLGAWLILGGVLFLSIGLPLKLAAAAAAIWLAIETAAAYRARK